MTDLDRLEELLAKAKDAQHALSMPGEPAYQLEQEWKRLTEANLQKSAAQALPALITELRQLREIVREAGEFIKQIHDDPDVRRVVEDEARALHNKIKEVMG